MSMDAAREALLLEERRIQRYFRVTGHDHIRLSFESLVSDPKAACASIGEHLAAPFSLERFQAYQELEGTR